MSNKGDISTESEVRQIYAALDKYEESLASPDKGKPQFQNRQSKNVLIYFLICSVVIGTSLSFLISCAGWSKDYIKLVWLILLLLGYLVLFIIQLMEVYATRGEILKLFKDLNKFFKNSNKVVFEGLLETVGADCLLASDLGKYSVEALQLVKNQMTAKQNTINTRLGLMVGALTKVGMIPGLLTIVLALFSQQHTVFLIIFAFFVFVLYPFAFKVHYSLTRFNFYTQLLDTEIDNKKSQPDTKHD